MGRVRPENSCNSFLTMQRNVERKRSHLFETAMKQVIGPGVYMTFIIEGCHLVNKKTVGKIFPSIQFVKARLEILVASPRELPHGFADAEDGLEVLRSTFHNTSISKWLTNPNKCARLFLA